MLSPDYILSFPILPGKDDLPKGRLPKLGNLGRSGTEMAPKFDLFRHSLFSYEDTRANAESFRYFLLRRNSPDSKGRIHSRPYALVVKVLRGESLKARGRFLLSSLATA